MENILNNFFANFVVLYGSQIKNIISKILFDECITVLQFVFSQLFLFINNNGLTLYSVIINHLTLMISNIKNKCNNKSLKTRCIHDTEINANFSNILDHHNYVMSDIKLNDPININNSRIIPTTFFDINQLDNDKITINIPMIFHLIDPQLSHYPVDYWTTHITTKIISQLNTDYNRNFTNYSNEFINNINTLFSTADQEKRNYYLNLANVLPNNLNVTWNFSLSSVIIKPVQNATISNGNNDVIFKAVQVADPNNYLNIIVAPGTTILGIAVFPFTDRNHDDPSIIAPQYTYRNAILINTVPFVGDKAPYDKFRTFTHEIGHWCGLLHPFDNQTYKTKDVIDNGLNNVHLHYNEQTNTNDDQDVVGDMIADTAVQLRPTFGTVYDSMITVRQLVNNSIVLTKRRNTPYSIIFENNNTTPNFLNFMDYTDDRQMCMFTFGQIVKIIYLMSKFRPNFLKVETVNNDVKQVAITDVIVNEQTIVNKQITVDNVVHQIADIEPIKCSETITVT